MLVQVAVLLYLCQVLVYSMWSRGTDPDNAAIPYLTAIGDLLGTALLAVGASPSVTYWTPCCW